MGGSWLANPGIGTNRAYESFHTAGMGRVADDVARSTLIGDNIETLMDLLNSDPEMESVPDSTGLIIGITAEELTTVGTISRAVTGHENLQPEEINKIKEFVKWLLDGLLER